MKKLAVILVIVSIILCLSAASYSTEKQPLTNADIIRMVGEGVSDEVILTFIKNSKTNFDVSVEAILQLQKAGVSQVVIKAVIEAEKKEREGFTPMTISPTANVNGFNIEQIALKTDSAGLRYLTGKVILGDRRYKSITILVDLIDESNNIIRTEQASWNSNPPYNYITKEWDFKVTASYQGVAQYVIKEIRAVGYHNNDIILIDNGKEIVMRRSFHKQAVRSDFFGIQRLHFTLDGKSSPFRLKNTLPIFELYIPSSISPYNHVKLVKFDIRADDRDLDTRDLDEGFAITDANVVTIEISPVGEPSGSYQLYRIKPTQPLTEGEYAILLFKAREASFFDFGIGEPQK